MMTVYTFIVKLSGWQPICLSDFGGGKYQNDDDVIIMSKRRHFDVIITLSWFSVKGIGLHFLCIGTPFINIV